MIAGERFIKRWSLTRCYRSDYPFTKASGVETLLEQMDRGTKEMFTENEINDVYHGNAKKLLA